jgi:predicted transcriptional regulator
MKINSKNNQQGAIMTALAKQIARRGIKQNDLAKRLGITPASVCMQIQTGIRVGSAAVRYAKALNCKPQNLMEF